MKQIFTWIRSNLLVTILSLALVFLLLGRQNISYSTPRMGVSLSPQFETASSGVANVKMAYLPPTGGGIAPVATQDRMVVKDTSLSLQVKSVNQNIETIEKIAVNAGGYMVDSNLTIPEGAATGSITIRIPSEKREAVITSIKATAVKTVSEYVQGTDVTDQYQNLEEQLRLINISKTKFESIQAQALRIQDILEVQRELINLQSQIDSIKGQQKYLEQTSKLTKITIYLSTDEFALPYTPDQPWRPDVIFKQAVRSLVGAFRSVATAAIWLLVYSPIWGAVLLVLWILRKKQK